MDTDGAGAAIEGLTAATTPLDLLRAGLEAVALRFALLDADLAGDHTVVATGGGLANSPAWTQIVADALGRPVAYSGVAEGSSRGAAVMALEALGEQPGEAPVGETFEPDPEATETYRAALERHGIATELWWDRQLGLCLIGAMVQFGWEKAFGGFDDELAWWEEQVVNASPLLESA